MFTLRTNYEQTMTSALAKRKLDSFAMFGDKKFVAGYQNLITIQPLNKSKKRGWFIRNSDLDSCVWTAEPTDFDKGSIIFDYEHAFGAGYTAALPRSGADDFPDESAGTGSLPHCAAVRLHG